MLTKPDLLIPLAVFCAVTLFTPGPNNLMLMTSGLNFGLKKSVPHIVGVILGFSVLVLCTGLGLGVVFATYPITYAILKYIGAAYMFYLAWMIAKSDGTDEKSSRTKRPIKFIEAVTAVRLTEDNI